MSDYQEKVDKWNVIVGISGLVLAILSFIFICIGARQVFVVGDKITNTQQENQNYVKCLSLLRFDNPELGPQSTRDQVEVALDSCAKVE